MEVTATRAATALAVPNIGQVWPGQGGIYAGVCRGRDGQPDYHLILAEPKPAKRLAWKAAGTWAKKLKADGHADFTVPDRRESRVLWANADGEFELDWHWTSTQYSAGNAWFQLFNNGYQYYGGKSYEALVRAVRRLPVNPSVLSTEAAGSVTA